MTPQEGDADGGRRDALLAGAVGYVLDHGVTTLSLRPLAAALGTSDRMLLYYFGTREALVGAILERIADQLRDLLVAVLPDEPLPPAQVLAAALGALGSASARRPLALWLQVVGIAATGEPAFAAAAARVVEEWTTWLAGHVDAPEHERRAAAAAVIAVIDGLVVLDAAGAGGDAAAGAAWLVEALSAQA
jgi:AcrR family transcriptional regulator